MHLSDDALSYLWELDSEHDGHWDGKNVWVGGSEYEATRG